MNIINHKKYFDLNYRFPKEEFKSIEGYERYRVSNWGRVSSHNNLILKPIPNGNGYYVINLYKENPGKTPPSKQTKPVSKETPMQIGKGISYKALCISFIKVYFVNKYG